MDDDIEDLVGDVQYTDSSKSISTSIVYSYDFSDSSPERNDSSGKETYVIDCDESDSEDTEKTYKLHLKRGSTDMKLYAATETEGPFNVNVDSESIQFLNRYTTTSLHGCSVYAQETFTQTSKTIFELAENDGLITKKGNVENLQTQTSFISITENKTVQYTIEVGDSGNKNLAAIIELNNNSQITPPHNTSSFKSTQYKRYDNDEESLRIDNATSSNISILDDSSLEHQDGSIIDTQDDSFMEIRDKMTQSDNDKPYRGRKTAIVNNNLEQLYKKVFENMQHGNYTNELSNYDKRNLFTLTPVTEESTAKSIIDITPNDMILSNNQYIDNYNDIMSPRNIDEDNYKLPPIKKNLSCPNTPHIDFGPYSTNAPNRSMSKSETLPCLFTSNNLHIETSPLASGENREIVTWSSNVNKNKVDLKLPPIHFNSKSDTPRNKPPSQISKMFTDGKLSGDYPQPICINEKIKELKMTTKRKNSGKDGRSISPSSSPGSELTERNCDAICTDLVKRLHSQSWVDIVDAMEGLPKTLENYWDVISEQRIADLLRQVTSHIESPRSQVAKSACATLAVILQNTNYVKKPDFYEAVSTLVIKTGSYSRPVRRAANLALDHIVCGVDLSHAVTAVCVHGVSHKSSLVRSAAARLLVVCAALAGGGRALLRARPSSAVTARQHLLRALSLLLEDKNNEARKYAERLYAMLRPLSNFDAYYLNDVTLEIATRQMKKYDQANLSNGTKNAR